MIRYARPTDHAEIAEINTLAFGKPDEAALIQRLRDDGDVMFELVADEDGQLQGHILYSRLWADNAQLYAALAPMAVRPGRQIKGLGSDLVRASLVSAREFGACGVLVLGHTGYYPKFGFTAEMAGKVRAPYSGSPAFMALEIERGAFAEPVMVAYPNAFSG
jgi:putative acetyltransferase